MFTFPPHAEGKEHTGNAHQRIGRNLGNCDELPVCDSPEFIYGNPNPNPMG